MTPWFLEKRVFEKLESRSEDQVLTGKVPLGGSTPLSLKEVSTD